MYSITMLYIYGELNDLLLVYTWELWYQIVGDSNCLNTFPNNATV